MPTSRATRVTSAANDESWSTIVLIVSLSSSDLAPDVDGDLLATGRRSRRPSSPRRCCAPGRSGSTPCEFTLSVRSFQVPETPSHLGLAAELALGADLARDARHLVGERAQSWSTIVLIVFFSSSTSPLHVDGDLLRQVAVGDRGRHLGDVAHLAGQVRRPSSSRCRSGPSRCPRRPSPPPGRRACPRCRPRARRASPRPRTTESWSTIVLIVSLQLEHLALARRR